MMKRKLHRRTFLKAAGVAVSLPALDAMSARGAENDKPPQRAVFICTSLGLHKPFLFPEKTGADYPLTPYLELLKEHRDRFTLFSGLSHPDQAGKDGHSSQMTWLTAAPEPGMGGFRNTISIDQLVAENFGYVTRFPTLTLSTAGTTSQSYTRSGVMLPAEFRPSSVFEKMFLQGKPNQVRHQRQQLNDGRSILDSLRDQSKKLRRQVSSTDRERLDEYFESIRETEVRFAEAEQWLDKPKPVVKEPQPKDIKEDSDLIGRTKLMLDLIPLAVQTDSTRIITVLINGRNDIPPVPGVSIDHHNLSHHGQDADKIEQLKKIELEVMGSFSGLMHKLKTKSETNGSLLDNTMVLFGSNLGNANAHDWRNLPIIVAGGDFKHGQHVAFDADNNTPLCNVFVTMMQRLGIESDHFASSTGGLDWS